MVKVIDGKHYMVASKLAIFRNLIIKASKLYDFQMKVNWITKTITLENENAAERFYSTLQSSRGVSLSLHGRKIKVQIPERLHELVD